MNESTVDLTRAELAADADRYKADYLRVCHRMATMHAVAVGEVRSPIRGFIEDVADLRAERDQLAATVERVRALAADMRTWCSPHNIAVDYAQRIDDALGSPAATG